MGDEDRSVARVVEAARVAGVEYARRRADAETARCSLLAAIQDTYTRGVSERQIAVVTGVDRGTVRKALGK